MYEDNFYKLTEETEAKADKKESEKKKEDKAAWYNPLHLAGRVVGYANKRFDQGFSKSYGGTKRINGTDYGHTAAKNESSTPDGEAKDGVEMGVGLGKPHADANHLYKIPVNDYDDSDASFIGDGEEKETAQTNIPAILAAKQAGGEPDPKTVANGINKRFKASLDPEMTDDNKELKDTVNEAKKTATVEAVPKKVAKGKKLNLGKSKKCC